MELHGRSEPEQIADIVITNKTLIEEDAVKRAKKLKLVAVAATGYNCVDIDACIAA